MGRAKFSDTKGQKRVSADRKEKGNINHSAPRVGTVGRVPCTEKEEQKDQLLVNFEKELDTLGVGVGVAS